MTYMMRRWCVVLAAGFLAGTVRMEASPDVPDFTALTLCTSGQLGSTGVAGGCSQSSANGSDAIIFSAAPFASLLAQAQMFGSAVDGYDGFGALNYSFEVTGGTAGDQVPLLIATSLDAISIAGYAFSEIIVTTDLNGASAVVCNDGSCGNTAGSFSGVLTASATSGSIGTVHLEVEASAQLIAGITASAGVDPFIYVDPSFAGASNYSILVSDGIGNAFPSSAPEPGSLSLGAIGVGAILASRWRR